MKSEEIKELLGELVGEVKEVDTRRLSTSVEWRDYRDALLELRGNGIKHITAITGTDLGEEIEIICHVECGDGTLLNLRTRTSKEEPKLPTITDIFPGSILYEREIREMLGIEIIGHPDPRKLFLPEDWPEHRYPLREGEYDYQKICSLTVPEAKEAVRKLDLNYKKLLEVEKKNENRKTFKNWIKKQIKKSKEGEE